MANYGQGMSTKGRYVGEFFDDGLPSHMSLLLTGSGQSVRRNYGHAVIEKIGGDNRVVQLRDEAIWFGGVTFAFNQLVEDDPFFSYRLAVWWNINDEPFFWYHS